MQATIAYTGSIEQVDRISRLIREAQLSGKESLAKIEPAGDLAEFVRSLDDGSLKALRLLAMNPGTEYTASEFAKELAIDVRVFYGFVGVVGRAWKKAFPAVPNPFASRWSREKQASAWSVGNDLASDLRTAEARDS